MAFGATSGVRSPNSCILLLLLTLGACSGSGPPEDGISIMDGSTTSTGAVDTMGASSSFSRPLTPNEALESFQLDSLFRIEIFAAEPHVRDPVDLVFDEYGRAYAAEMLDYPNEDESGASHRSRIRLLVDTDEDGRIDSSAVFADSLRLISGLQPWNGGLIVTSAPEILFLRDTDGDGAADERRTLFTGFAEANPQHRASSPRFAIDNWIYVANDGNPGNIRPAQPTDGDPVSVLGADFRFRLPVDGRDDVQYEPASGPAQFGQAFDAFGQRFITHNTVHVRHVVLPREYFARNPYLTTAASAHDISDHGLRVYQRSEPQAWRISRTEARQRRYTQEGVDRTEHRADVFTAVAGAAIVDGEAFPRAYRGNLFTGETAANLVHRDVLSPAGVTFAASRAHGEEETEFLTSTDPWFRPDNLVVGPDGYLYVVDMYRAVIESPEYIPESIRSRLDFRRGTEFGRIYRISPRREQAEPAVAIADAPAQTLVRLLADPNPWRRLTAHRLLLERGDRSVADGLGRMVQNGDAAARLHALYVLDGLGALDENVVSTSLDDRHPGVRERALRFAESFPSLYRKAAALAGDPSDRVRLQAALTLGSFPSGTTDSVLVQLAARNAEDPWIETAILSAPPDRAMMLFDGLLADERFFRDASSAKAGFIEALAAIIGARGDHEEIGRLVSLLRDEVSLSAWREAAFSGLANGFALRGFRHLEMPDARRALEKIIAETAGPTREAVLSAARHFRMPGHAAEAAQIAADDSHPIDRRVEAAADLATGSFDDVEPVFAPLLQSNYAALQAAAIHALATFTGDGFPPVLLERWNAFGPSLRRAAAGALSSNRSGLAALLDAVEGGSVRGDELDMDVRLRLLDHPERSIRRRAELVLENRSPDDAATASRRVLERNADARRGRDVFYRECARCHAAGAAVGPDLVGVSNKSREQLLEAIVSPSSAVPATYAAYVAELSDGSVVSGRIIREMPGTLTFRSEKEERTVLRTDVRSLRAASLSMMPDDFGASLGAQELADVIAFLQAGTGL